MFKSVLFSTLTLGLGLICCGSADAQTFANVPTLSFTKIFGGANPLPQVVTATSTGANFNYDVAVSVASGGSWLQVTPSGNYCCTTPSSVVVSVSPVVSLAAGTYTGQIVFTNHSNANVKMTVPVVLTIAATSTAYFDNLPGQMSFSLVTGGKAPPSKIFQIRNGGTGTLAWTMTSSTADGGHWLTASATSGTAPSLVTLGVSLPSLPGGGSVAGTYLGQIVLSSGGKSVSIPVSVTVGTDLFPQLNPIFVSKSFGGNDPLPQILPMASAGDDFNVDVSVYTGNGGQWLTVTPSGNYCCTTPEFLTVTMNPAVSLAAGTYTAEVIIATHSNRSVTATIPVTLTIASPATQTFFDNLPGLVSFSLKTGGAAPPSQSLQVRNAGAGTLSWTLAASTADGGAWITPSVLSGTAPGMVSLALNPAQLPDAAQLAGTFVGQLVFQAGSALATVPLSVSVGDSVFEQVNGLSFTKTYSGPNPLPQNITMASTGSDFNADVNVYTANGGSWLTVSPSGNYCCTTPEVLTVSVNAAAALPAGTYTGQVVVLQHSGRNAALTIPVTLTVKSSGAYFDNMPGQMSFFLKTGGTAPPAQTFQVRNAGTGTLSWTMTASTSDGGAWLTASPISGTAPSTLTIGINKAALPAAGQLAGTFTGQLVFQTAAGSTTVPVSVIVGDSVFQQVNPISFNQPYAGAKPLPQTLTIASTGADFNVDVTSSTSAVSNWLVVTPTGNYCCTTPVSLTVSVNPAANLAAGTYTGQVVVTEHSGRNMSMTVPVTFTVAAPTTAFFDNLPGQLSFSLATGGKAPPSIPFQIRNGGGGALNWMLAKSTSDGANWLSVSAASGTAPATVSVSINPALLPGAGQVAGTFTGQILLTTAGGTATIPVSVSVGDSVYEQVNPLSFVKPFGGANPLPQTVMVASTGDDFNLDIQASTATGGSWLTVTPVGNYCCTTHTSLVVAVNAAATLAAGTYTGQVVVTQHSGHGIALTIPVTLTVPPTTAALFDNVQGQLSYSMVTHGTGPANHSIQIRNGGQGTMGWTLSTTTSDGGKWITVSSAAGNAPSAVSVGVNVAALPNGGQVAGTFTGQVLLQTATGAVTIPVSVEVGDNVFQQLDTVTFSKGSASSASPAPQSLTLNTTGAAISLDVVGYSGKGGNWLVVSPSGNYCCTSQTKLTLSINSSVSLPNGFYTAEIVANNHSNHGMSMTIPVYFAVGSSGLTATTTSIKSSVNPSNLSQAVTFTATVAGGTTGLSGTVTFSDGSLTLGTAALSGTTAAFTTSALAAGAHSIAATYNGNTTYSGSTSPAITQTVVATLPTPTTTLTSSLNPAIVGKTVTFVATVSNSATGSVTFKDGTATLATVALANAVASYSTTTLAAGSHSITAVYGGNTVFAGSTSSVLTQSILKVTTTALSSSKNPASFGQFVTLTATVTGAVAGQNGFVTFFDGGVPLSSVPLNGAVATLVTSGLAKGAHTLTAVYGGSAVYAGSSSPAGSQTIQ